MKDYRLDVSKLRVLPDGELPSGTYWYRVEALLPGGEVDLANVLKVFCPYRANSVSLFWDEVPGAEAFRIYRRGSDGIEGSITVSPPAFFHDNGLISFE